MRKNLQYTTKENALQVFLILLLIVSMILVGTTRVGAQSDSPAISVNPTEITVPAPGQNFTVEVNVTGIVANGVVGGLGVWEFKLSYNTTLLDAVYIHGYDGSIPDSSNCTDWGPGDPGGVYHPDGPPAINDTAGYVWTYALFPYLSEFTGNGTMVRIDFTATAVGNCTLHLYVTRLGDRWADPITHESQDAEVTVIPEFPALISLPLLLIATLAITLLGKMFWSKKRKDAPISD